jgi:hypothetical protein
LPYLGTARPGRSRVQVGAVGRDQRRNAFRTYIEREDLARNDDISGVVTINGIFPLNGALVALSSEARPRPMRRWVKRVTAPSVGYLLPLMPERSPGSFPSWRPLCAPALAAASET